MDKRSCVGNTASNGADVMEEIAVLAKAGVVDFEAAADAILEAEGVLSRDHGIYTQRQLARRMQIRSSRLPSLNPHQASEAVVERMVMQRLDELVTLACLNPMEEICLHLRVSGMSPKLIAGTLRIGRRRVDMHLRTARRKVRHVYHEGPYAGWYEVYLSEVRRGETR